MHVVIFVLGFLAIMIPIFMVLSCSGVKSTKDTNNDRHY